MADTMPFEVPDILRSKASASGASQWLDDLPGLVADLASDWAFDVVQSLRGGTSSLVVEVVLHDATPAVLKLAIPSDDDAIDAMANEITSLLMTNGEGCARLLRHDAARSALLLERLGRPLNELGLSLEQRHEVLCATALRMWRPAPDSGLPTGASKGMWLMDFITGLWEELDQPCADRTIDHALACAQRRIDAHDDDRAVLVHGDVHGWNALEASSGFKFVDPSGLVAEAEYDMGIIMREDPIELMQGEPMDRAHRLAELTGLDPVAIWEWGVVERVSTGLLATRVDLQPIGREMLDAADRFAP